MRTATFRDYWGVWVRFRNSTEYIGPSIRLPICQEQAPRLRHHLMRSFRCTCPFWVIRLPFMRWICTLHTPSRYRRAQKAPWVRGLLVAARGLQFSVAQDVFRWMRGDGWKNEIWADFSRSVRSSSGPRERGPTLGSWSGETGLLGESATDWWRKIGFRSSKFSMKFRTA